MTYAEKLSVLAKKRLPPLQAKSLEIKPYLNLLLFLSNWKRGIGALILESLPNGIKRWEQPSWWGNPSLGMKLSVSKQRMGQIEDPLIEWSSPNMRSDWIKESGHHDGFRNRNNHHATT